MPNFKRITSYTDEELREAITDAISMCGGVGLDFWTLLKGCDAYMEQRTRKLLKEAAQASQQGQPSNVKDSQP